jgi:hypothetical protein
VDKARHGVDCDLHHIRNWSLATRWAMTVSGNWRFTFRFVGENDRPRPVARACSGVGAGRLS